MIEYRLLGPLEALEDGHSLPLGGRQQRAVLAILLLHANRFVPTEQLIDALWGEAPPPTAAATVHVYISRLRKLLGRELVVTRNGGYLMRVDPDAIDAMRAERLVARARRAEDPGERAGLLREALALWHGMPLGDLAYEPFGELEAERLEEERLGAVEDRIEAELALGGWRELVPELERLVADHPLRERPRGQLMRALYRSGQQAEALAAYRDARSVLRAELGLEPSPALQELERQILNQDPALGQAPTTRFAAEPPHAEPTLLEERKLVTVLFADLVGFTPRVELDPEDARELRRRFQRPARVEVERFGGTVERFLGDTMMAVFGAPTSHEDDAERAVRAAFAILDALVGLDVQIGVATGPALVSLDAMVATGEGMVAGDVVSTASHLRTAAPVNAILVDDATRRATEHAIQYHRVERVHAKGNPVPIPASRAVRGRAPIGGRRPPPRSAAMVGRSRELELLRGAVEHIERARSALVVTVVGAPGIGKTRLLTELRNTARTSTNWLVGRSLAYGDGVPFYALAEAVRAAVGIVDGDAAVKAAAKLERAVHAVLAEDADWVSSHLRPLVGLEGEQVGTRAEAFSAWRRFFEGLAQGEPLVLALEDVQWADEGLLDFVDHLRVWTRAPLLVLCTARPDLIDRRSPHEPLQLTPLSNDDAGRLLDDLLGDVELAPDVRDAVVGRADGNPLFVEEFARTLAGDGEAPSLPRTVQGVIAGRLDGLPPHEKRAVHDAAVLGNAFSVEGLVAVSGSAREDVLERLAALEHRQFVRRASRDDYAFGHVLVRDVAYEQIPRRERADCHLRAAKWLESLVERVDERADALAYHYRSAFGLLRAVGAETGTIVDGVIEAIRRAGERARALYANEDAEAHFRDALELVGEAGSSRELVGALHESLGDVLELQGKHPEGEAAYTAALEVVPSAQLHRKTAQSLHVQRRIAEAHAALDRAEAALDPNEDRSEERVEIEVRRLWLHYYFGSMDALAEGVDASRGLIEHGTPAQRAALFQLLSLVALRRRRYAADEEVVGYARDGLAAAEESMNHGVLASAAFELGFCLLWAWRPLEAELELRRGLTLAESVGDVTVQTRCLTYLALAARIRGEVDGARALADRTLEAAEAGGMIEYVAQSHANLAWADWRSGDLVAAERHAKEAWELWQRVPYAGFPTVQWVATWPLIVVLLAHGRAAQAVPHARALLDPDRQPMPDELRTALASAVATWDDGDPETAKRMLESATALAAEHRYL